LATDSLAVDYPLISCTLVGELEASTVIFDAISNSLAINVMGKEITDVYVEVWEYPYPFPKLEKLSILPKL